MKSSKTFGIQSMTLAIAAALAMTLSFLAQTGRAEDIGDIVAGAVQPGQKAKALSPRAKALTDKMAELVTVRNRLTELGTEVSTHGGPNSAEQSQLADLYKKVDALTAEISVEQKAVNREELIRRLGNEYHASWQTFARDVQKRTSRFKPMGLESGEKIKTQAELEAYLEKRKGSKAIDANLYKFNAETGVWEEDIMKLPNEALSFKNSKENTLGATVVADLIDARIASGKPVDEAFTREISERVHDEWTIRTIRGMEPEFGATLKAPIDYSKLTATDAGKAAMERIKVKDAWAFGNIKPFAELDDNTKFLDTLFGKVGVKEVENEARIAAGRNSLLIELRIAAAAEARALETQGSKAAAHAAETLGAGERDLIRELQEALQDGKGSKELVERAGKSKILGQLLRGGITAAALTGIVTRVIDAKDAATGSRTEYDPRGVLGAGDGR